MSQSKIYIHHDDIPADVLFVDSIAIDTETMGLNPHRDRLCVVQLSSGDGSAHIIKFKDTKYKCPNLIKILQNEKIIKIFHYARFDLAVLYKNLHVNINPVYCTKIASRLVRNFTHRHGLKRLCSDLLGVEISKQSQSSDWGSAVLTTEQITYAASDVQYLHRLKNELDILLIRENRLKIAEECFKFLPTVALLDLLGYEDLNIFAHST